MINKTKLALGIATATLTIAGALVAPQAVAGSKSDVAAMNSKVEALEAQLQAMQYELQALRAEASRPAASADSAKVQELDQWMNQVKSEPVHKEHHDNTLFFRGGYAGQDSGRGGTLDPTAPGGDAGALNGAIGDEDGWYFGAGFDFGLTDDVWGMMDNTQVLGELMFDYTELGTRAPNGVTPAIGAATGLPAVNTETATVNMLRLSASPKIKFLAGSAFRPWLIPVGFELDIISPPSDAITVLTPAMQFGGGVDYRIWKDIFIGVDARYHYAPGDVDGVDVSGVTAGGYLGIGF
ncbi:MAG: porin family protein [Methylococcaceae bacterium]